MVCPGEIRLHAYELGGNIIRLAEGQLKLMNLLLGSGLWALGFRLCSGLQAPGARLLALRVGWGVEKGFWDSVPLHLNI